MERYDSELGEGPILVTTPHGAILDLGPLVGSARALRKHVLQSAEFGEVSWMDARSMDGVLFGMETAVRLLGGEDAADLFHHHVHPE